MDDEAKKQAIARLKKVVGQLDGIIRMVEGDRYCVDIMVQLASARAALTGIAKLVLSSHLDECVTSAVSHGSKDEKHKKLGELFEVFARFGGL